MPENAVLTSPITEAPEDQKLLETGIEDEFELDIRVSSYSKTFASPHATSACRSQCVGSCWCGTYSCDGYSCVATCDATCTCTCNTFLVWCC